MDKRLENLLKAEALEFDTRHLNQDASAYDICPGDAFIKGALWFMEHFNVQIQYIADGSTSVFGHKENNWRPEDIYNRP